MAIPLAGALAGTPLAAGITGATAGSFLDISLDGIPLVGGGEEPEQGGDQMMLLLLAGGGLLLVVLLLGSD